MISLTFDVEPDLHSGKFEGVEKGIPIIKEILDKHKIKATFFTACCCIEKYPEMFRKLKQQGHEIALHGYMHERFDDLSFKQKEEIIIKSMVCFKKYLGAAPKGFRAPQHSIDKDTLKLLSKYKFKYDSSNTPLNALQFIFFPKRFMHNLSSFFSNPKKHKLEQINELPPTSLLIPFISLILRIFPKMAREAYLFLLSIFYNNIIFYAHCWDFVAIPGSRIDKYFPHTKVIKNLDSMIFSLKKKNIAFKKIEEM